MKLDGVIRRAFKTYCDWIDGLVERIEKDRFLWAVSLSVLCAIVGLWHARPAMDALLAGGGVSTLVPDASAWKTIATTPRIPAWQQIAFCGLFLVPSVVTVVAVIRANLRPQLGRQGRLPNG